MFDFESNEKDHCILFITFPPLWDFQAMTGLCVTFSDSSTLSSIQAKKCLVLLFAIYVLSPLSFLQPSNCLLTGYTDMCMPR